MPQNDGIRHGLLDVAPWPDVALAFSRYSPEKTGVVQ
jgi:hypothetical protein